MKKFHYVTAYKGAFHQNPDYTHWYGNAPLKLSLSWIRSESEKLRRMNQLKMRVDNQIRKGAPARGGSSSEPEASLRDLRERFLSGEISQEEYGRERKEILDRSGL